MKKCLSTVALITIPLSISPMALSAESVDVTIGADYWWSSNRINNDRRDKDNTPSLHAVFRHEHSYLPSFKIRYSTVDAERIKLDKYDYTFFYEVIEHEMLEFDLGLTLSQYTDTEYLDDAAASYDFDGWTWSFYANGVIDVPNTNLDIIGQFDFADRNGKKTADVMAGFQYRLEQITSVDLALRGGYRVMDYTFSELGTPGPVEILIDGWFAGAEITF